MNAVTNTVAVSELSAILRRAAELNDEIAARQVELNGLLAGKVDIEMLSSGLANSPAAPARVVSKGGKRHFTPESLERIRAAQRRRWKNKRKLEKANAGSIGSQIPPATEGAQASPATSPSTAAAPATEAAPVPKAA